MQQQYPNVYPGLKAILPLLLVVFIDALGMAIIFPILNPIFMSPSGILPADTSIHVRNMLYGLTLSMFPLAVFFGTPILGDMSDFIGRKKILLICLAGVGTSYILSGFSLVFDNLTLLIGSRIIAGLFGGSMATAQAAAMDVSHPDKKAATLSLMLLPAALGFVAGPLAGSFLSDGHLITWFNLSTPLFFAGILAYLNFIALWFGFNETHRIVPNFKFKWHRGIEIFVEAFANKDIRFLSVIYFGFQLGWGLYFQFIALFLFGRYAYTANHVGLFMALLGVGFCMSMLYLVNLFTRYFKNKKIVLVALFISTICLFITVIPNHSTIVWIVGLILAVAMSTAYPVVISLYSDLVGEDKQGWVMGVGNAVFAVAWAVTAVSGGFLQSWNIAAGITCAAIFVGLSTVAMYFYSRRKG
jgi:MFS transporter, DHA1 family, tetracycline resistance protein